MLTRAFIARVRAERIVDTRAYRYVAKECYNADKQWLEIRRLPIDDLDTTKSIDGWETVAKINQ